MSELYNNKLQNTNKDKNLKQKEKDMEEIIRNLEEIAKNELEKCKKNKTIPREEILDIVRLVNAYRMS